MAQGKFQNTEPIKIIFRPRKIIPKLTSCKHSLLTNGPLCLKLKDYIWVHGEQAALLKTVLNPVFR